MVDIVVNNVMSTSLTPDYSNFFFKDPVRYSSFRLIKPKFRPMYTIVILSPILCGPMG